MQTSSQFNRWDSTWPLENWTYAVSVRAQAGDSVFGTFSPTLSAVAKPELAPPPQNILVEPTDDGFTISWDPPTGPYTDDIVEYNIIYWDFAPEDCQLLSGAAFKSSPATITGLLPGRNYLVAPLTWNAHGQGLPTIASNVVPGGGIPPVPGIPSINPIDSTSAQ